MGNRKIQWDTDAWNDYLSWQTQDRKTLKRVNRLINEISRDPFHGSGKPELLKKELAGFWSRRIDETNRIVYTADEDAVYIISCKGHYSDH